MKSEERHQLLQNDLQVVTTKTVGFFERHLMTMIGVVVGVLFIALVAAWWNQSSQAGSAAGWTMLDSAIGGNSLEEFGDVADKFKGKPPGQWAQLQIAEKTLQSAMPLMFTNRDIALADLKRAREGFDALLQDKSVSPAIRERALWGLALTLETGCDGDTAKPIEAYERLLSDFPDSIFKSVADERIRALKKPSSREFYTWFSKEKPKPTDIQPRDFRTDGSNPHGFPFPAEDTDDFKPKLSDEKKPSTDGNPDAATQDTEKNDAEKNDTKKNNTEDKDGDKKDADAKPDDKPNSDKPANPDKPADEKPTEKN